MNFPRQKLTVYHHLKKTVINLQVFRSCSFRLSSIKRSRLCTLLSEMKHARVLCDWTSLLVIISHHKNYFVSKHYGDILHECCILTQKSVVCDMQRHVVKHFENLPIIVYFTLNLHMIFLNFKMASRHMQNFVVKASYEDVVESTMDSGRMRI